MGLLASWVASDLRLRQGLYLLSLLDLLLGLLDLLRLLLNLLDLLGLLLQDSHLPCKR